MNRAVAYINPTVSMWYRREESQKRFSFFFISTALAGAFGGLLASAIGKMDGYHGKLVRHPSPFL
jgi:hypothetical protein